MQLLNRLALALLFIALAHPATAQMRGTFGVGVGISTVRPIVPELKTKTSFGPTVRRVPSRGWGFSVALHWFDANVDARVVGGEGPLGRLIVRPLMFGIGYTGVRGRLSISPSFVAGPALNTVVISEEAGERFQVTGTTFQRKAGTVSLAIRPGVSLTYALTPRFGLTGSGGYIVNRPKVVLRTPDGDMGRRWRADGVILSTGVVVTLF